MRQLAEDRNFVFISSVYTNCDSNHCWQCRVCDHTWEATPNNVMYKQSGCPKCAGHCQSVETMHELAKLCGLKFLSDHYKTMSTKYKWKCPNGHISQITANSVKQGTMCSYCNRGIREEECRFIIESLTKYEFPVGRINGLELDGYCSDLNIAFEYNGKQHYEFMPYFHKSHVDFEKQIERDNRKAEECQRAGINKLDIPYLEATNKKYLTKFISYLLKKLNVIIDESKINWENFHGKRKFLEETIKNAARIHATCLSKTYFTAKTKLTFKCLECDHIWKSTPSNIKTGHGCPVCGYVKRAKSRKETMSHDN